MARNDQTQSWNQQNKKEQYKKSMNQTVGSLKKANKTDKYLPKIKADWEYPN